MRASPAGARGSSATKPFHPPRSLAAGAGGSFDASCRSSTRWIVLTAVKGVRPAVVDLAGRLKTSASARRALLKDFGLAPADIPLGQSLARLEAGGLSQLLTNIMKPVPGAAGGGRRGGEGTTAVRGLRPAPHGVGRECGPTDIARAHALGETSRITRAARSEAPRASFAPLSCRCHSPKNASPSPHAMVNAPTRPGGENSNR